MLKQEQRAARTKTYSSWKERSMEVRNSLGMPASSNDWCGRPGVNLRGLPDSPRQRDVLDVCFRAACRKRPGVSVQKVVQGLWANPSQNVDRLPFSTKPATFSSGLTQYSFEKDAVLSAAGHLKCVGWPKHYMPADTFTEPELRTLAADSFSVPIAGVMRLALYYNPYGSLWKRD